MHITLKKKIKNQRHLTGVYFNVKTEKTKVLIPDTTINLLRLEDQSKCELETENNYVQQKLDKGFWEVSDNTLTLHMRSSYSPLHEVTNPVNYKVKFKIRSNKLHHLSSKTSHDYYYKES